MSGHTHTYRKREKSAQGGESQNIMCILWSKQKVIRPGKTASQTGNHTIYEHNMLPGWFGWCFPDKQIPSVINNPAAGKRDWPNECSINQKDARLPPTSCIHSPTLLFHLFPSLEFLFRLSGKQYVLDRQREQDITACVKKNTLIRDMAVLSVAGTFCLSHLLSLTHSSPVVSCEPLSLSLYGRCFQCGCRSVWEWVQLSEISICIHGRGRNASHWFRVELQSECVSVCAHVWSSPVVNFVTSSTLPTGQLSLKAYKLKGFGSLLSSPHSSWFGEVHRPASVS